MPSKNYFVEGIGSIDVYKRRGTRRLSLRVIGKKIRVTQPFWLPYKSGLDFAINNKNWIIKQIAILPDLTIEDNKLIGKQHRLVYSPGLHLRSKITENNVIISLPAHLKPDSPEVETLTKKTIKKALRKEAESILTDRVEAFADKFGFNYSLIRFKSMRSRWGSCNNQKEISLNIFLLMLPYELIDYVILHELVHTRVLNHSKIFWKEMSEIMPDYKQRRKLLKNLQYQIIHLH